MAGASRTWNPAARTDIASARSTPSTASARTRTGRGSSASRRCPRKPRAAGGPRAGPAATTAAGGEASLQPHDTRAAGPPRSGLGVAGASPLGQPGRRPAVRAPQDHRLVPRRRVDQQHDRSDARGRPPAERAPPLQAVRPESGQPDLQRRDRRRVIRAGGLLRVTQLSQALHPAPELAGRADPRRQPAGFRGHRLRRAPRPEQRGTRRELRIGQLPAPLPPAPGLPDQAAQGRWQRPLPKGRDVRGAPGLPEPARHDELRVRQRSRPLHPPPELRALAREERRRQPVPAGCQLSPDRRLCQSRQAAHAGPRHAARRSRGTPGARERCAPRHGDVQVRLRLARGSPERSRLRDARLPVESRGRKSQCGPGSPAGCGSHLPVRPGLAGGVQRRPGVRPPGRRAEVREENRVGPSLRAGQ